MSDRAFLAEFITEPLYLISEKDQVKADYPSVEEKAAEPARVEEPKAKVELKALTTSGNNLKGCIILVSWGDEAVASEKELLLKILSSVKLGEGDVLIAHASGASHEQIEALLAEQNHKHVLDFGTSLLDQVKNSPSYTPVANGYKKYLKADRLDSIATSVDQKKALWKALQDIFL
ncbi:hypothetical protein [Roseivirga sp.]|uniref:hypothetical protein n=1 Tax=Roseivirga sp. TaxID=1964215 RepID=UPI003B52D702